MEVNVKKMVLAALFAALTAVGAFLKFPLGLTSVSLQFFFTALAGVLLGARWGALSQLVYVALGLVGVPIFTQGGGLGYLFQPSMGFLFGLIPAAWLIGRLAEGASHPARICLACVAGLAVLYVVALPYMYLILNVYLAKGLPLWRVIRDGMLVYLPGDALKIAVVTLLSPVLSRRLAYAA